MIDDEFVWYSEEWKAWEGLGMLGNTQGRKGIARERSNSHWRFSIVGVVVSTVMGSCGFVRQPKASGAGSGSEGAESGFCAGVSRRVSGNGREGWRSRG